VGSGKSFTYWENEIHDIHDAQN
jgi:hypothetical protein